MYEQLTSFLPRLQKETYGSLIIDRENDGSPERPIRLPYVHYDRTVMDFEAAVYRFVDAHAEMELKNYHEILERAGIRWGFDSMKNADETSLDGKTVVALILGAIRAERFSDGALMEFCEDGCIQKWLKRLKAIDDAEAAAGCAAAHTFL